MIDDKKPEPVALKFPRQPNREGGWTVDFDFLLDTQKHINPEDGYLCLEDVERVLLAAEQTYAAPPVRKWVGLTDREVLYFAGCIEDGAAENWIIQEIEAALKAKNA